MAIPALSQHFVNPMEIPAFTFNKVKWDFKTLALTILTFGVYGFYHLYTSMEPIEPIKNREVVVMQSPERLIPDIQAAGYHFEHEKRAILKALTPLNITSVDPKELGDAGSGFVRVVNTKRYGKLVFKIIHKALAKDCRQYKIGRPNKREGGEALALTLSDIPGIAHTRAIVIQDSIGNFKLINSRDLQKEENRSSIVIATLTEYIEGKPLSDSIFVDHQKIKSVLRSTSVQLREMHAKEIIHRDLSPTNIIVTDNGASIIDLGLAKNYKRFRRNSLVGNPAVLAPEVALGQRQDDKVDIWALGCNLCYMNFGLTPFPHKESKEFYQQEFKAFQDSGLSFSGFIHRRIGDPTISRKLQQHYLSVAKALYQLDHGSRDDKELGRLISALIGAYPGHRLNINEVLDHPYLSN